MEFVEISEAEILLCSIRHSHNHVTASEALKLRDKWLLENDLGVLHMALDVRALLENVFTSAVADS